MCHCDDMNRSENKCGHCSRVKASQRWRKRRKDYLLRRKGTLGDSSGIVYEDGNCSASERPFIPDPDQLPFPARELFPLPLYQQPVHVLMSRGGCPFKCVFAQ